MKKLIPCIVLLLPGSIAYGQQGTVMHADSIVAISQPGPAGTHKLRTNNEVTPRWTIEASYRYGGMNQKMKTYNLSSSYSGSLPTSGYPAPKYSNKNSLGGSIDVSYFFNKKHTLGVGLGAMYMQHTGTISVDSFKADYRDVDGAGRTYRQIIRSNGPLSEDITITNVNVPVMLKFKNQFKKNFGVWADIGGVLGIYNTTKTNRNDGNFNYEAIYRISHETNAVVSGFDVLPNGDPVNSLILTEQNYHATNPKQDPAAYFDLQHAQNQYNVGLNKSPAKTQNRPDNSYSNLSYGGIIQGGISLAITYRLTFNLGAYYMYQHYENGGNGDNYHITDRIVTDGGGTAANYYGLSRVLKQSDYSSVGAMAGIRIFLGGKGRDTDGDGFIDDVDECPLEWGTAKGCPDDDHDGFRNTTDLCPDVYSLTGGGCPDLDGDGFVDKVDSCINVPGNIQGCPVDYWSAARTTDTALVGQNGIVMAPHIVLEMDVLHFAFGKATIEGDATQVLSAAATTLANNPQVIIHISGYTDDIGSYANNLVLSLERAKAAKSYLISQGVPEDRIIVAGLGNENPVITNDSPDNRAKNRRIEMKLLLPVR